jgi:hypothetical protein
MTVISTLRSQIDSLFVDLTSNESRKIGYRLFRDILLTGRNLHYPNMLLSGKGLISPYDERVMSLQRDSFYDNNEYEGVLPSAEESTLHSTPVFFFCYNVDNYFHFLYDSLPYLYYFLKLRETVPNLELLIQTSHPSKKELPQFVRESLELLGIRAYIFAGEHVVYSEMYVGLSMTHGGQSNDPPHPLASEIWSMMSNAALSHADKMTSSPNIYISRRSWLSKNQSNIGTNYTTRRKCINEDELVATLTQKGFQEVFCEDMTMSEKIVLFANAKNIVGVIGGGMCNCLFTTKDTIVHCLLTPHFITINARFAFSMNHTRVSYDNICSLAPHGGKYPLYSRAKLNGVIGEINDFKDGMYELKIPDASVAGFSQDFPMKSVWATEDELVSLDAGLNSPYVCDIESLSKRFVM